ncbi:MAG: chloride channel protein [Candidatus Omnitrophica bacterium]|nr:chloride channel protein [Candidatus Omnitrophota bacterium]
MWFSRHRDLESPGWMLVWGSLVGLFTGGVTVLYRLAVLKGNETIWGGNPADFLLGSIAIRFLLPPLGGLVVGFVLYKLLDHRPGHGIPSVIHSVQTNQVRVPWRMAAPSVASVVVLTTGGSAGPEGPVAEIGSVFGSNMGSRIGAKQKTLRVLVGCGVAAAIAAVFGAPIGGVFFALEVIFQGFELTLFAPVVISAVVASLITSAVFEVETAVVFPEFVFRPIELPAYVGLGLIVGLVAGFFIHWIEYASRRFERLEVPLWIKPAIGGIGVGALGCYFLPEVIGEGYESLNHLINSEPLLWDLAFVLFGKILATGLTLGSGAPGGCFAPAIFIGATLGALYGGILERLSPDVVASPSSYATMGMAGMIAGTFNAPMTAILVALRVADENPDALLPLMTTVALASFVMSRWEHVSVYTNILKRHGQWFPVDFDKDPLLGIRVEEVVRAGVPRLSDSLSVDQAFERIREREDAAFVVEGAKGEFRGVVTLQDLRLALADPFLGRLVNLEDVVDFSIPRLSPNTSLREAVREFATSKREALPVFTASGEFVGLITREEVLSAYRRGKEV